MSDLSGHDSIAALATPVGRSALAVIRTAGTDCVARIATAFSRPDALHQAEGNTLLHGYLSDPESGERLDEVVLGVYRAPRSYTGEDAVEIMCHGGPPGVERLLSMLRANGFRQAEPGEFTQRAFLAGKMDLTRAEAVQELVNAQTERAHAMALQRLGGSIERRINEVKDELVHILSAVNIQLDYPEEETGEIPIPREAISRSMENLRSLLATYRTGRLFREGARVVLAGPTNAGKSSLFNLFLREDRSIVSDTHGTTRDYIEQALSVGGVPVRLYDTAGLRDTREDIESEGIRRSARVIESADVVLYVVDGSDSMEPEEFEKFAALGKRAVGVWNKIDRLSGDEAARERLPEGFIPVSAVTGEGFDRLEQALLSRILPGGTSEESAVIDSARQKELLERCLSSLQEVARGVEAAVPVDAVALDLQDAVAALGEITGEVTTADVLDAMFGSFCVGK